MLLRGQEEMLLKLRAERKESARCWDNGEDQGAKRTRKRELVRSASYKEDVRRQSQRDW